MMTPELFEQNLLLRNLAEEAKFNATYINLALNNAAFAFLQVPLAVMLDKLAEPNDDSKDPYITISALHLANNIVVAVIMVYLSWSRMSRSLTDNPFSMLIPVPSALIKSMLTDRSVMIENEALLQQYIAELEQVHEKQKIYINVLFTLRTIMLALMLDVSSYNTILNAISSKPSGYGLIGKIPVLSSHLVDTIVRVALFSNKKDPRKFKLPFVDFSSSVFFEEINKILVTKINLTITNVEVLAVSSLDIEGELDGTIVVKATLLKNAYREKDTEKSLFMLKALLKPGSAIFKDGPEETSKYTAYLNFDVNNISNKQLMLDFIKENLKRAEIKADKFFKCKEILMGINEKYNCASDIKHGFQCDGPLETFVFSNIIDIDLNNLLQQLKGKFPNIVTVTDEGYSFSMSALDENKFDFIKAFRNISQQQDSNTLPLPAPASYTTNTSKEEPQSLRQQVLKRFRNSFIAPAVEPAVPIVEPQGAITWAHEAYNQPEGAIVPTETASQLAHITGTSVYIYYPDAFVAQYEGHIIQRHIDNYRKMIGHHDTGNGIKTIYSKQSGQLVAYYTSDDHTNPRMVFKAVSYAFIPNENNKHKMKKVILLEPFKVCETHEVLKRLDLAHPDLKASAQILSMKQEPGSKNLQHKQN